MWKKIAAGIVILLILAAGIGYYLLTNLDGFIKSAIEKYGSAATQTERVGASGEHFPWTTGWPAT